MAGNVLSVAGDDLVGLLGRHLCQSCPTVSEKLKQYPLETNIMNADQRAKANAEMAKSSGQATNAAAAPPAEKQHGQPGDSKSTFQKLKESTKTEKPAPR